MSESATRAVSIRAPRDEDTSSIAALAASVEAFLQGSAESTAGDIRFIWGWPGFDSRRDAWLATLDGEPVGYAWVWGPRSPEPEYDSRLLVRLPDFAEDVAEALLERMEARAREKNHEHGLAPPPRLAIPCGGSDRLKQRWLAARGYLHARTFLRMQRSLEGTWGAADFPPDAEVSVVRSAVDEVDLYRVLHEAFADHYRSMPESFQEWKQRNLIHPNFAPALSFVVRRHGEPIAATANYGWANEGMIGMLGVRRPWRRLGLGRSLLLHSFTCFRDAGLSSARLAVDAENADRAVALYESVGMTIVRRQQLLEKTLSLA